MCATCRLDSEGFLRLTFSHIAVHGIHGFLYRMFVHDFPPGVVSGRRQVDRVRLRRIFRAQCTRHHV